MDTKTIKILFKTTLLRSKNEYPLIVEFGENIGSLYIDDNIDNFLKAIDEFIDNNGTFEELLEIFRTYSSDFCKSTEGDAISIEDVNEIPFDDIVKNPTKVTNINFIAEQAYAMSTVL